MADDFEEFDDEDEIELVSFKAPLKGDPPDLSQYSGLVRAGLLPARELVSDALDRRAEMIRVEPRGPAAAVKLYIDGVGYPGGRLPAKKAAAVTQMMKVLAGLDATVRDRAQSGVLEADLEGTPFVLRVEAEPSKTKDGKPGPERLTVRAEDQTLQLDKPEDLGITAETKELIRTMTGGAKGAFFTVGPPLSGVTTTSFGVLRCVDAYIYSIYAVGDLGGRDFHTLTDYEPDPADDPDEVMEKIIRSEAHAVFLNPRKSPADVQFALKYGDRLNILSEFPAKDLVSAAAQLLKWTGDAGLVADRVTGLIQPKLVRRLCGGCKLAFRPNPKLLKRIGLPEDTPMLFRPPGSDIKQLEDYVPCQRCGGVGYLGRTGIFAVMKFTDGVKKILTTRPSGGALRQQMKEDGMPTFESEALRLVADGTTSLEELQRLFKE